MNIETNKLLKDHYDGLCYVCGKKSTFVRAHRSLREGYKCEHCQSSLRYRGQAQALLEFYGLENTFCLKDLVSQEDFRELKVFEPGIAGPFRKYLATLEGYINSFYWEDVEPSAYREGIQCQNLEQLSFDDESFDLIVSSDIMEHVRKYWKAFEEIWRVLKPGGLHVFSIPVQRHLPSATVPRVDTSGNEDIFLLEPHYHGDGAGGKSLVYVDYGLDIIEKLSGMGWVVSIHTPDDENREAQKLVTFIAKKQK